MRTIKVLSFILCTTISTGVFAAEVTCQSAHQSRTECKIGTRGDVRLVHQLSKAPCFKGVSWGPTRLGVWVDKGCGAVFTRVDTSSKSKAGIVGPSMTPTGGESGTGIVGPSMTPTDDESEAGIVGPSMTPAGDGSEAGIVGPSMTPTGEDSEAGIVGPSMTPPVVNHKTHNFDYLTQPVSNTGTNTVDYLSHTGTTSKPPQPKPCCKGSLGNKKCKKETESMGCNPKP